MKGQSSRTPDRPHRLRFISLMVVGLFAIAGAFSCQSSSTQTKEESTEQSMTESPDKSESYDSVDQEESRQANPSADESTAQPAPGGDERRAASDPNAPPAEQGAPGAEGSSDLDMPEDEFEEFVETYRDVARIQQTYQVRMQNASDRDEAKELQMKAQQEMMQTVDQSDLSQQRFNTLAARIQEDPEFREQVTKELQEQKDEGS